MISRASPLPTEETSQEARIDRLRRQLESRREPVIVVEAAAGMGKSRLLSALSRLWNAPLSHGARPPETGIGGIRLWDVPLVSETLGSLDVAEGEPGRLIVAIRPNRIVPGLDRLNAYRLVYHLPEIDLLWSLSDLEATRATEDATDALAATGGWPLLVGSRDAGSLNDDAIARFIDQEILGDLDVETLVRLSLMVAGRPVEGGLPPLPLARARDDGRWCVAGTSVLEPLKAALTAQKRRRIDDDGERTRLVDACSALGFAVETIRDLQGAGFFEDAERLLRAHHGWYFLYFHGAAAFDAVMSGFPEDAGRASNTIVLCRALQALKHGEVSLAQRLIAERFGPEALDPAKVLDNRKRYSAAFRCFRLVMLIYEDIPLTDELLRLAFTILDDLPLDAHLLRGSLHNAILEFYLRTRRLAEADDVAERALLHYRAAGAGLLAFYISLHLAMMRLMAGDANAAADRVAEAEADIARLDFDSPHDLLLLKLLKGCIAYEGGNDEALILFLNRDLDLFSHGEIWPTLVEFALQYGSQALSRRYSTIAARSFLDRWRVYQVQNRQFQVMIDSREVAIMQNGNRWREAAEKLMSLATPIGRTVASDPAALGRLANRDEIAIALCWLRHMVFETPTRPDLPACLAAIHANLALTARQRAGVEIWTAYIFKRQRDLTRTRATLRATFETVAGNGCIGPLSEEMLFLSDILSNRRISDFLAASGSVRQVLRRLRDFGLGNSSLGARNGLSRQETKVLIMISEGASNKFVAKTLQISEATVKFHLGNVYRKLGCQRRKEAIAAARSLGLVS